MKKISKGFLFFLVFFLVFGISHLGWGGWEEEMEAQRAFQMSQGMCYSTLSASSSTQAPGAMCAAAAEDYKWPGPYPRTLKLKVIDQGVSDFYAMMKNVQKAASTWSRYAGINFEMEREFSEDHDIVMLFDKNFIHQASAWSTIGTNPTTIKRYGGKPILSLPQNCPHEDMLHEFGHVLGLVHEMQNPSNEDGFKLKSNQEVCAYYKKRFNWSEQMVMQNILRPGIKATNYSQLDPASIMMYPFPKEIVDGNYEIPKNKELSATDKKFISQMYPKKDFIYIPEDDPRVSRNFSSLGDMFQTGGLIWSGVPQTRMSHPDAVQYCQGLGARLPTEKEWEALVRAMRSSCGIYDSDLLPGTRNDELFWSSDVDLAQNAYYFKGKDGSFDKNPLKLSFKQNVRCVVSAGARSSRSPIPVPKPQTVAPALVSQPVVKPVVKSDPNAIVRVAQNDSRVSRAFAKLGDMYQAAGLIWSGVAPNQMNHYDAEKFCQGLGEQVRLPTKEEWEVVGKIMSPGGIYNPDLFPGIRGKYFWASSVYPANSDLAFYFSGVAGKVPINFRGSLNGVRCVVPAVAW